jgi:hypothetical protein
MLTDSALGAPFTKVLTNANGKVMYWVNGMAPSALKTRELPPAHPISSVLPAIGERRPSVIYPRDGDLQVRSGSKMDRAGI